MAPKSSCRAGDKQILHFELVLKKASEIIDFSSSGDSQNLSGEKTESGFAHVFANLGFMLKLFALTLEAS